MTDHENLLIEIAASGALEHMPPELAVRVMAAAQSLQHVRERARSDEETARWNVRPIGNVTRWPRNVA